MQTRSKRDRISKILVVDDHSDMLDKLVAIMAQEGFKPLPCSSAKEALELAAEHEFGVSIIDLELQQFQGAELLRKLQSSRSKMRVIIYTASASMESAKVAVNEGAFAYLEKSNDPSELLRYVHKALRSHLDQYANDLEEQVRHTQKMDAIGRLAGGVAHDFNNLLSVVSAYAGILQGSYDVDLESINEIGVELAKTVDQGASLTRKLSVLSRDDVREPRPVAVRRILTECHQLLKRIIGEHIHFEIDVSGATGRVNIDPGHLEQIVMNLVLNARDAMPHGGRLLLRSKIVDIAENVHLPAGQYARLIVQDTGIGMDIETTARIFEPFFTTKSPEYGTGLGLSVVYGIVRQYEGQIQVQSGIGAGTTFEIDLPMATETFENTADDPNDFVPGEVTGTILLAEDEPALRNLICQHLENHGFTVLPASSGTEALEIAEGQPGGIDLLLSDVIMPKMGGRELSERLREGYPDMKVIFISGYTDALIGERELAASEKLVQKPLVFTSLLREIRDVLLPSKPC